MTAWEWRDLIADGVIPAQLLVLLGYNGRDWWHRQHWRVRRCGLLLFPGAVAVYGWQAVDARLGLWSGIGWDYSTHTAAAALLVGLLVAQRPRHRAGWLMLGIAYSGLMLWQGYHGIADVLSTLLVLLATLALPWAWVLRRPSTTAAGDFVLRRPG